MVEVIEALAYLKAPFERVCTVCGGDEDVEPGYKLAEDQSTPGYTAWVLFNICGPCRGEYRYHACVT